MNTTQTVTPAPLPELDDQNDGRPLASLGKTRPDGTLARDFSLIKDVEVCLTARLGGATLTVDQLFALSSGAVLPLDTRLDEEVALYLDEQLVARGNIVAVDDSFGIEISEIKQVD